MAIQEISADEILTGYDKTSVNIEQISPLQKVGIKILFGIGVVGTIVILVLLVQWILQSPKLPTLTFDPANAQQAANTKALLESYKTASDLALDAPAKWFDTIIVKIVYPAFTLVLGYIFGERIAEKSE